MSPVTPLLADVREFFTMRAVESRARAISADDKVTLRGATRQLHERRLAAEALWTAGCTAQSHRLVLEAFELASSLARRATGLGQDASDEELAQALELSPEGAAEIGAAREAIASSPSPVDDNAFTVAHVHGFPRVRRAAELLERAATAATMTGRELDRARLRRRLLTFAVTLATIAGIVLVIRALRRIMAEASALYGPNYEAARVLDGNKDTEWLLPDGQLGWIDLRLGPPRKVKALRLVNAHNWHYHDRGTKEFNIEVWSRGKMIKLIDGAFGEPSADSPWVTFDISSEVPVDRIRIGIKSFYLGGAGLGEVSIVE